MLKYTFTLSEKNPNQKQNLNLLFYFWLIGVRNLRFITLKDFYPYINCNNKKTGAIELFITNFSLQVQTRTNQQHQ